MHSAGIAQESYQGGLTFKSSLMLLKLMKWVCKLAAQLLPLQIPGVFSREVSEVHVQRWEEWRLELIDLCINPECGDWDLTLLSCHISPLVSPALLLLRFIPWIFICLSSGASPLLCCAGADQWVQLCFVPALLQNPNLIISNLIYKLSTFHLWTY